MTRLLVRFAPVLLSVVAAGCGDPAVDGPVAEPAPPAEPRPAEPPDAATPEPAAADEAGTEEGEEPTDPRARAKALRMRQARRLAGDALAAENPALAMGFADQAHEAFRSAARLDPSDPIPLVEAGILALETGHGERLARLLAELESIDPEAPSLHYLLGAVNLRRQYWADAAAFFNLALDGGYRVDQSRDRLFRARLNASRQFLRDRLLDEALEWVEAAIEADDEHPLGSGAYYTLAIVHRRLAQPEPAEEVLRLCIDQYPSYAPAYGELGDLLEELDRHDESMQWLERSNAIDPDYPQGYLLRAKALIGRDRLDEADAVLREFQKRFREAESWRYQFERGRWNHKRGRYEVALEHFRRVLALEPDEIRALYEMALVYRDIGEMDLSRELMDRWTAADKALREAMDHEHDDNVERRIEKQGLGPQDESGGEPE